MMHWLDLNGLTEHLKQEKNTQYESFQYTVAFLLVSRFPIDQLAGHSAKETPSLGMGITLVLLWLVFGLIAFLITQSYYRSNGEDFGKDFLHRTLALSWVIGCRIACLAAIFFAAAYGLIMIVPSMPLEAPIAIVAVVLLAAIWAMVYYVTTMNQKLREIRLATQSQSE